MLAFDPNNLKWNKHDSASLNDKKMLHVIFSLVYQCPTWRHIFWYISLHHWTRPHVPDVHRCSASPSLCLNDFLSTPYLCARNERLRLVPALYIWHASITRGHEMRCLSHLAKTRIGYRPQNECTYSGSNNYLIPCWFCRFAHLQIMELCIILIIATF